MYVRNKKPVKTISAVEKAVLVERARPKKVPLVVEYIPKHTGEQIDSINLGGSMSIWHIQLDSGYEEVIFAEDYTDAYKKAEYNEKNPDKKSNGFEMFYTLAKDIRDIRDDIEKIKKIIKIPED